MSDSTEKTVQSVDCSQVQTDTSEIMNNLRSEVQHAYSVHNSGEWTKSKITNISLKPVFKYYGKVYSDSSHSQTTCSADTFTGNHKVTATQTEAPFASITGSDIPWDCCNLSQLPENIPKIDSIEKLYSIGSTEKIIVPTKDANLDDFPDGMYLYGDVYFEIVGELTTDELMGSQEIVIDTVTSVSELSTLKYFDEVKENNEISAEYKFTEGTIDLRLLNDDSLNLVPERTVVRGLGLTWLTSTFLVGYLFTSLFFSENSTLVPSILFILTSIGFLYIISKIDEPLKDYFGKSKQCEDVPIESESTVNKWFSFDKATALYNQRKRVQKKASNLKKEIKCIPRDVTVYPNKELTELESDDREITWKISNENIISEKAVDFFVEYGFEKDMNKIETQMVKDTSKIEDDIPTLESENGNWHLLPKDVNIDPIISI